MNARWLILVAAAVLFGCSSSDTGSSGSGSTSADSGSSTGSGSSTATTGSSAGSGSSTSGATNGSGSTSGCSAIPTTGSTGAGTCQDANGTDCSTLALSGCPVHEVQVSQDAPPASGGTPVGGTYVLTTVTDYLGTAGTPAETNNYRQGVLKFTGSSVEIHEQNVQVGGPTCEDSQAGTVSFSGTTVTLTPSCPTTGDNGGTASYSATATTFTLFEPPDGNRTYVRGSTYTRQ